MRERDDEHNGPQYIARREVLARAGGGIGGRALTYLLGADGALADILPNPTSKIQNPQSVNPLAPRPPHFPAKAKRVISLFMFGGISHIDTFDPKEELTKQDG